MKIYIKRIEPVWVDVKCLGSYDIEEYASHGYDIQYVAIKGKGKISGSIRSLKKTIQDWEEEIKDSIQNMTKE